MDLHLFFRRFEHLLVVCAVGWLILSKVQNYMVYVNFPIYLDPRSSLSEKYSKNFHVYYPRKQDLVLYYELLRGEKEARILQGVKPLTSMSKIMSIGTP